MRLRADHLAFVVVVVSLAPLVSLVAASVEGCGSDDASSETAADAAADATGDVAVVAVDAATGDPCALGAHVCKGTTPLMCQACGPAASPPGGQCPSGGSGTVWVGEEPCNLQIKGAICIESAAGVGCGCPDDETNVDGGCVADAGVAPDAAGADAGTAADAGNAADASDAGNGADAGQTTDAAED